MPSEHKYLEPYFRNGLLYVPQNTVEQLIQVGLDATVGRAAARGLKLDDERAVGELRQAIDALLMQVEPQSAIFAALTSADVEFMLTGVPEHAI